MVGDNRAVVLAPFNVAYEGLREQIVAAGLGKEMDVGSDADERVGQSFPLSFADANRWNYVVDASALSSPTPPATLVSSPTSSSSSASGAAVQPMQDISVGQSPLSSDGSPSPPGGGAGATLMPPSDFNMFPLPVRPGNRKSGAGAGGGGAHTRTGDSIILEDVLEALPFPLDSQFRATVLRRANKVRHITRAIEECGLQGPELQRLKAEIDGKFKGWIMSGGGLPGRGAMELSDLNHMKI